MDFKPSRHIPYMALASVVIAILTVIYRKLYGNNTLALVLGLFSIVIGVAAFLAFQFERQRYYGSTVARSQAHTKLVDRGRKIGWLGGCIVVGSFMLLGVMIKFSGAANEHMLFFEVWLVVFLIGFALLWAPVVMKWGILLGIIPPSDDGK